MADRKLRVLFVDDEPGILKMVGKRLEIAGFEVVTAVDGEDALAKSFAVQPDLVVLDLMLPKISGLKVCPQLKQDPRTAQIPVIIFTGKDQDVDQETCRRSGADSYVPKALGADVLISEVRSLLKKAGKLPADDASA